MKPFRKNLAIAVDGGGIRGLVVTQALAILEEALGEPLHHLCRLTAGTSTGAIIAAALATGIPAAELNNLYKTLGAQVFPDTWRKRIFPLVRYRYPSEPLETLLKASLGEKKMVDYWVGEVKTDVIITAYDLVNNKTLFIKSWKDQYADWPVVKAVHASCTVPTYFPVVEGRYIDGGVGSYSNPAYLAAYEASQILQWDPTETTLLSFGTGRAPHHFDPGAALRFWPWQWLGPMFGAFLNSADDQQVHLVETFFEALDFRRFQVDLKEPIEMDGVKDMDRLVEYGKLLGEMVLNDTFDRAMLIVPSVPADAP
jgi:uncharacterized protein